MKHILPGKKEQLARDMKLVKEIKPKLRKYLIDTQVRKAAETAKEQIQEAKDILSAKEIYTRALSLSYLAWQQQRLWIQYPPYMRAKWTTSLTASREMEQDRIADISGFQLYLIRMYKHHLLNLTTDKAIPNPLKEENLVWFWKAMQSALALAFRTDQSLVDKGNAGLGIVGTPQNKEVRIAKP